MTAVKAIAHDIEKLSPNELAEFRSWFAVFDSVVRGPRNDVDAAVEKIEALAVEAISEYEARRAREI